MIKRTLQALALILLPALLLASLSAGVLAAGPVVNTAVDESDGSCTDGDCSLRDAIATAANGDTITFDGDMTIYLDSTLQLFSRQLTIDGSGHTVTVSGDSGGDGSPNVQVFYVGGSSTTVVTLTHLNIISGTTVAGAAGGGIVLQSSGKLAVISSTLSGNSSSYGGGAIGSTSYGTVTVQGCTFSGNSASGSYGGAGIFNSFSTLIVQDSTFSDNSGEYGGGISNYNGGTVTVENCTFSGNSADWGGGINNYATLTVQNSTFYGNSATWFGGGINNYATLTVQNSTFYRNSAAALGGGITNSDAMTMSNTLIANSTSGDDCYGLTAGTNNLVEDGSCSASLTGDPLLGPLADNGGATQTMAPLPGSPVIDAGAGCLPADQRGIARPQGAACDIGAFESQGFTLTYGNGSDQTTLVNTPFANPLTLTVSSSAGEPVDGGQVIFTGPASGAGLSSSPLTATIVSGTVSQVVTANTTSGSYLVTATTQGALSSVISYSLTNITPEMAVIGNAQLIDDGDTSPATEDHTDFGTLVLGQSLTHTFTISNSGTADLSLTGSPLVAITGPGASNFSVVVQPITPVSPNATTTFQMRFAPSVGGTQVATVTIANNDSDENPYDFAIQGSMTSFCYLPLVLKSTTP
mgnify:CR=1 FL=1